VRPVLASTFPAGTALVAAPPLALFSISRYIVSTLTMFWTIERVVLF
jgi:ABC-type maltose transport system permease subunit